MNKKTSRTRRAADRDTMRRKYDFSKGVRGATAERYAEGRNVVAIDPSVLEVFPDAESVNETLRALAPVLRHGRKGAERLTAPYRLDASASVESPP